MNQIITKRPSLAKALIDDAAYAGVDCVKFQVRNMKKLYKSMEREPLC